MNNLIKICDNFFPKKGSEHLENLNAYFSAKEVNYQLHREVDSRNKFAKVKYIK